MTSNTETHRTLYAALITSGIDESLRSPIRRAFAQVPRERFMGAGPWDLLGAGGYVTTPTSDPELLYQDVLVALKKSQRLNSGQPSMHARNIAALDIKAGQTIAHIGAGTGYFSAILAELVGASGQVNAYEIDAELEQAASDNLAPWSNVTVQGDAVTGAMPPVDAIYINAGLTGPQVAWLNALKAQGKMLFPMTDQRWSGGQLLLQRSGMTHFTARFISPVSNIPCVGARDDAIAAQLTDAFANGLAQNTRSLFQDDNADDTCLLQGDGWWLSSREL